MCGEGKLLLVSDCCLYLSLELRGDLPNPVLLCVFRGILHHFLFSVPPYNMCASGRWINLGALNDFPHGSSSSSLLSPVIGPAVCDVKSLVHQYQCGNL